MSKHRHNYDNQNKAAAAAIPEVEPENALDGTLLCDETEQAKETAVLADDEAEMLNITAENIEKQRVSLSADVEEEKPELVVELSKIYDFEGEEVEKVDLSGLENISEKQQVKVDKLYRKITKTVSSTPEFTPDYGVAMTHVLTGIPLEIVRQFSFKDKIRIKNAIMAFLYGED